MLIAKPPTKSDTLAEADEEPVRHDDPFAFCGGYEQFRANLRDDIRNGTGGIRDWLAMSFLLWLLLVVGMAIMVGMVRYLFVR